MKKRHLRPFYILPFFLLFILYACKPGKPKFSNPKGYDLSKPERFSMPESLMEISGHTFRNGNPDTVYSIQDEDGKLFKQAWGVKKQKHVNFGAKDDYEDVAILQDMVFILNSDGDLISFPFAETQKKETKLAKKIDNKLPDGEYESLFADPKTNKLYILCKSCTVDKKNTQLTGYVFQYDFKTDTLSRLNDFKIDLSPLKTLNAKMKTSLKPSALAKNQFTNEWYILASASKLLVITDENWKIKEAHRLDSSVFNQPEGIAFDNKRSLYISNEGDEMTNGNILKFNYVYPVKK